MLSLSAMLTVSLFTRGHCAKDCNNKQVQQDTEFIKHIKAKTSQARGMNNQHEASKGYIWYQQRLSVIDRQKTDKTCLCGALLVPQKLFETTFSVAETKEIYSSNLVTKGKT